jgi:hypothetical protein
MNDYNSWDKFFFLLEFSTKHHSTERNIWLQNTSKAKTQYSNETSIRSSLLESQDLLVYVDLHHP